MEFTLINALILLGAGLVAGLVAGFAGVGGGIVMVPVLLELMRAWGVPTHAVVQSAMAMGTNLAGITMCTTSIPSGQSMMDLYALIPRTSSALGLMG